MHATIIIVWMHIQKQGTTERNGNVNFEFSVNSSEVFLNLKLSSGLSLIGHLIVSDLESIIQGFLSREGLLHNLKKSLKSSVGLLYFFSLKIIRNCYLL